MNTVYKRVPALTEPTGGKEDRKHSDMTNNDRGHRAEAHRCLSTLG